MKRQPSPSPLSSFSLESLGCAKNQVDSEIMIAVLEDLGLRYAAGHEQADVLIVNTCGFIDAAKEESLDTCLALRARYPAKRIVLAGCLAQRYGELLEKELPEVDAIMKSRDPREIGRVVAALGRGRGRDLSEGAPGPAPAGRYTLERPQGAAAARRRLLSYPGSVYVKIADGCDNRCTYCAIPLIKGALKSRSRKEVLTEIAGLLERGIVEINLIAQDLGSYGLDRGPAELPPLLEEIAALRGDFWVRLLYIHPDHFPLDTLDLMKRDPRFLPYFDIPFQHADELILRAMGRRGSGKAYLRLIERIRSSVPDAVIRSTFLVGFPGETEKAFGALLRFQEEAELDWLGIFSYSREEDTPAFSMKGRVKRAAADRRRAELESRQVPITEKRLARFVGRSLALLTEEAVAGDELYLARGWMHAPEVDGLAVLRGRGFEPGRFVTARIIRRNGIDLEAVPWGVPVPCTP